MVLISKAQASDFSYSTKVSFLTEYYSRGISQTREKPAPQIMSTVFHKSGLYAGIFASRVEFFEGDNAEMELDLYTGIHKQKGNLHGRAGLIYYKYPNADSSLNYDFFEFDLALGYNFGVFSSEASLKHSPNYFAHSGKEQYLKLETKIPIEDKLRIQGHLAHRSIEKNEAFFGLPDNFDWEMGVHYAPLRNLEVMFKYVDSSFDKKTECLDICNERLIAGISYSF